MASISIIVPIYNIETYLYRCLDSILAQTFSNFELIIVDDGSTDGSGIICDEYAKRDNRIRVFHQSNQGQAAARNIALDWIFSNSDSKYITFVDGDDWIHPKYLELLYTANQRFGTNISQCLFVETDGMTEMPLVKQQIDVVTSEEQYINWYSAFIWGKLYSKTVWQKMRFPEGQIYEDLAIWYKILFSEKHISIVNEVLYYYFYRTNSTVHSEWDKRQLQQLTEWDKQIKYLRSHNNLEVFENAVFRYVWVMTKIHYPKIQKSSRISHREKAKYERMIKQKVFLILFKYGNSFRNQQNVITNLRWASPMLYEFFYKKYRFIVYVLETIKAGTFSSKAYSKMMLLIRKIWRKLLHRYYSF